MSARPPATIRRPAASAQLAVVHRLGDVVAGHGLAEVQLEHHVDDESCPCARSKS